MILKIVPYHTKNTAVDPEQSAPLRTPCEDANPEDVRELVNNMLETVAALKARGLAANQVGENVRVIVAVVEGNPTAMINPVITKSLGAQRTSEGCLSLPNAYAMIERPEVITVEYLTTDCSKLTEVFRGDDAAAVCHEIDHLDGKLMIDHMKPVAKRAFLRRVNKFHRKINRYTRITLPMQESV